MDKHDTTKFDLGGVQALLGRVEGKRPEWREHHKHDHYFGKGNRTWALARRCNRTGCKGPAVRGSTVCAAHGGLRAIDNPERKIRVQLRKMAKSGALPVELSQHPLFMRLACLVQGRGGPAMARMALGYKQMMDTGEASGWLAALDNAKAVLDAESK
jgi:hypothetical protein